MADSTYRTVPAVDKAARLLSALAPGDTLGISELARRIDASKGTVRDILLTLAAHGLVERTEDGRFRREAADAVAAAARPHLRALMEEFGETAILGLVAGRRLEIVERAEPSTGLHMSAQIGRRIPLERGAHAKVLAGSERIGYDDGEYLAGVRAVAAPILDARGARIGALLIVGFKERIGLRTLKRMGARCAAAADAVTQAIGRRAA